MKFISDFEDIFMSPQDGSIPLFIMPDLPTRYTYVGDLNNKPIPSPILIDLGLDIIQIRSLLDNAPFIIQYPIEGLTNSQALNQISNGLIANNDGVIVPAQLATNNIWIGDDTNRPQASGIPTGELLTGDASGLIISVPQIQMSNLPNLTYNMIWVGDEDNVAVEGTLPIEALPSLTNTYIWIGNSDNQAEEQQNIQLINLPNLPQGYFWSGNSSNRPYVTGVPYLNLITGNESQQITFVSTIDQSNLPALPYGNIWVGDDTNRPQASGIPTGELLTGDADGLIVSTPIIQLSNLPNLTENYFWLGDDTGRPVETLFEIEAGTGLNTISGEPIVGNGTIYIEDTGVIAGSYTSANITVNAQGQITAASNGEGSGGTVTEITLGTGLTGVPNPIIETGTISITDTGVVAGEYFYLTATINAQGQILSAIDNESTITEMQDNIATNTTNIATNTSDIATLNTAVFAPVTGLVSVVFDSFGGIGLVSQITSNTDKISEIVDESDTYISQIEENTTNIATNTSDIAGIIAGIIPIATNFTGVGDVSGSGPLSSSITLTLNTTLNNVPLATGDVNVNNHKIINLNDATNPKDAVNLETLEAYVGGLAVELDGFVEGGPAVGGILTTTRGPDCTLDVIPAAADVSFDNFAITDLETLTFSSWSDMETKAQNGINFLFLWQFFGGGVS